MADWIDVEYCISGPRESIELLNQEIDNAIAMQHHETKDAAPNWIGKLSLYIQGLSTLRQGPGSRAFIENRWIDKGINEGEPWWLFIQVESAWVPCDDIIVEFVKHFVSDVNMDSSYYELVSNTLI